MGEITKDRTVTLMYYGKTSEGWKRLPIVEGGNGKIRPGFALVADKPVKLAGRYVLRFYEGGKVKYEAVGTNATEAKNKFEQKKLKLRAEDTAEDAGLKLVEEQSRIALKVALGRFLKLVEGRGSAVAADAYRLACDEFLDVLGRDGKRYADELTVEDIAAYHTALRKRGLEDRTIYNRHCNVLPYLRYMEVDVKKLAPRAPGYEDKEVETYTAEELQAFFDYLESIKDDYSILAFNLLLRCGLREQEGVFLMWGDIEETRRTLKVQGKPHLGFKVKDKEQRRVPVDAVLLALMQKAKESRPKSRFVIGTRNDTPNWKLLLKLKRRVKAAGLNCGVCQSCMERDECERWYLHKFRHTYCTKLLRQGIDVKTVQQLAGHSDLTTTMRYLKALGAESVRDRIDAINWGAD
jgi:integrase